MNALRTQESPPICADDNHVPCKLRSGLFNPARQTGRVSCSGAKWRAGSKGRLVLRGHLEREVTTSSSSPTSSPFLFSPLLPYFLPFSLSPSSLHLFSVLFPYLLILSPPLLPSHLLSFPFPLITSPIPISVPLPPLSYFPRFLFISFPLFPPSLSSRPLFLSSTYILNISSPFLHLPSPPLLPTSLLCSTFLLPSLHFFPPLLPRIPFPPLSLSSPLLLSLTSDFLSSLLPSPFPLLPYFLPTSSLLSYFLHLFLPSSLLLIPFYLSAFFLFLPSLSSALSPPRLHRTLSMSLISLLLSLPLSLDIQFKGGVGSHQVPPITPHPSLCCSSSVGGI